MRGYYCIIMRAHIQEASNANHTQLTQSPFNGITEAEHFLSAKMTNNKKIHTFELVLEFLTSLHNLVVVG